MKTILNNYAFQFKNNVSNKEIQSVIAYTFINYGEIKSVLPYWDSSMLKNVPARRLVRVVTKCGDIISFCINADHEISSFHEAKKYWIGSVLGGER